MSQLVKQYIERCTSDNNWYIQKPVETLNVAKKVNFNAFAIDFWYIAYFSQTQPYFWHVDGVSWSTVKLRAWSGNPFIFTTHFRHIVQLAIKSTSHCFYYFSSWWDISIQITPVLLVKKTRSLGLIWICQVLESGLTPFSLKLLGASGICPPKKGPNSNQNMGSFGYHVYVKCKYITTKRGV